MMESRIAQLAEQSTDNACVAGSNPATVTNFRRMGAESIGYRLQTIEYISCMYSKIGSLGLDYN